jgi:hypothetical protein
MMTITSRSCSWCHRMNDADSRFCQECGHEAHVARLACRCRQCVAVAPRLEPLPVHFACGYCGKPGTQGEPGADGETWYHPACWKIVSHEGEPTR